MGRFVFKLDCLVLSLTNNLTSVGLLLLMFSLLFPSAGNDREHKTFQIRTHKVKHTDDLRGREGTETVFFLWRIRVLGVFGGLGCVPFP